MQNNSTFSRTIILSFVAIIFLMPLRALSQNYEKSSFVLKGRGPNLIIFIHGLDGDPIMTWTNKSVFWPRLLESDSFFNSFDSYTAGYDCENATIQEIAPRILDRLEERAIFETYENIYIVAHSLGGLILKEILCEMSEQPRKRENLSKVKAVVFFSTPSTGTKISEPVASMVRFFGNFISSKRLISQLIPSGDCPTDSLTDLENRWINFKNSNGKYPLKYATCETEKTKGFFCIDGTSSITQLDGVIYPISGDHAGVVKPDSTSKESFIHLKMIIVGVQNEITTAYSAQSVLARPSNLGKDGPTLVREVK